MMKQLAEQVLTTEKIELHSQNEAKKQIKFIGKMRMQRGQKVFQLDLISIVLANF